MADSNVGVLYVVATPIGNLGDIVPRAIEVLQKVDVIAAEDTRHSTKLLQHFGISTRLIAYHDYSNEQRLQKILDLLMSGQSVALISDAGTPLISDPGYHLVHSAREQNISVVPIPGACALVAALSVSGLPSNQFIFEGFLPAKSSSRRTVLASLLHEHRTVIFYESPHRIVDSLKDFSAVVGGERDIVIARELTKTYETVFSGSVDEVIEFVVADSNQQRGEFVLLVKGCEIKKNDIVDDDVEKLMYALLEHVSVKTAASIAAKVTDVKKRDLYQWALANADQNTDK